MLNGQKNGQTLLLRDTIVMLSLRQSLAIIYARVVNLVVVKLDIISPTATSLALVKDKKLVKVLAERIGEEAKASRRELKAASC